MNWMGGRRRHSNNHIKDAAKQYFSRQKEWGGGATTTADSVTKRKNDDGAVWGGVAKRVSDICGKNSLATPCCQLFRPGRLFCARRVQVSRFPYRFFEPNVPSEGIH